MGNFCPPRLLCETSRCFINEKSSSCNMLIKLLDKNLITAHVICVYKVVRIDRYALSCNASHTCGTIGLEKLWLYPCEFAVALS